MRILVGSMLLYTHAVWTLELETFFSAASAIPTSYRTMLYEGSRAAWSHFDWSDSAYWLWGSHAVALVAMFLFTIGFWTRWTGVLSFLFVVSYANRATGALFGLDQINAFLTLYLVIGSSGSNLSWDAWRRRRSASVGLDEKTKLKKLFGDDDVLSNIATRLIQLHLCVVYLFAGLGKLQGTYWWNAEAIWGSLASYEYQSIDMTWIAGQMWLVNLLTYVAVAWEVSYPFLIWPKLTRPIYLLLAVAVHVGIGLCMGMLTFGLIMIYGNLAFVPPKFIRQVLSRRGVSGG
jgi:hypothetical protein